MSYAYLVFIARDLLDQEPDARAAVDVLSAVCDVPRDRAVRAVRAASVEA